MELYIHEARMHGAEIVPPCVNNSPALCTIKNKTIYLGLGLINELEAETLHLLLMERSKNGLFKGLYDFIKRISVSVEQVCLLIRSGAFRFTGKNKKELMWEAYSLINPIKKPKITEELFDVKPTEYTLPALHDSWLDDAFDEIELFGFSLCSPFQLLKNEMPIHTLAKDLTAHINKTVEIVGYFINNKTVFTAAKKERMYFGTFLDLDGYWIDTVHFPPSAKAWPFQGPGCYLLKGRVVVEFDHMALEIQEMHRLAYLNRNDIRSLNRTDLLLHQQA